MFCQCHYLLLIRQHIRTARPFQSVSIMPQTRYNLQPTSYHIPASIFLYSWPNLRGENMVIKRKKSHLMKLIILTVCYMNQCISSKLLFSSLFRIDLWGSKQTQSIEWDGLSLTFSSKWLFFIKTWLVDEKEGECNTESYGEAMGFGILQHYLFNSLTDWFIVGGGG